MRKTIAIAMVAAVLGDCGGSSSSTSPADIPAEVHVLSATVARVGGGDAILGFSAHNAGGATDTLVAASCSCADDASIVGPGSIDPEVTGMFGPNGDHVLLHGLHDDVRTGDFVDVTLTFANAGNVTTQAEVVEGSS
jgi:copper(I)-binding protein